MSTRISSALWVYASTEPEFLSADDADDTDPEKKLKVVQKNSTAINFFIRVYLCSSVVSSLLLVSCFSPVVILRHPIGVHLCNKRAESWHGAMIFRLTLPLPTGEE
jgi:hypothetical protein